MKTMEQLLDDEDKREAVEKRGMRFTVTECGSECPFYDKWPDSDKCFYTQKYITEHDNHPFPVWCELEVDSVKQAEKYVEHLIATVAKRGRGEARNIIYNGMETITLNGAEYVHSVDAMEAIDADKWEEEEV